MDNMPVDNLIEALEEWNGKRNNYRAQDYLTLLMLLNADIGNKLSDVFNSDSNVETQLRLLRTRILELSQKEKINQVMLIEGIVSKLTRFFANGYKSIVHNLATAEGALESGITPPEAFEKFKTIDYRIGVELDEKIWNEIVSQKLCKYTFNKMDDQILLEQFNKHKDVLNRIPEEDKDLTMGELKKKYRK